MANKVMYLVVKKLNIWKENLQTNDNLIKLFGMFVVNKYEK